MIKKVLTKENIFTVLFVIVALHPLIELDYLAGDFFNSIGLPRLTTVIDFVVLPLLVLLVFILFEKKKKRVLILAGIYALLFGVYFLIHVKNANAIQYEIHLTENYYFSISDEIIYTLTLLLPLVYIYVFSLSNLTEKTFYRISVTLSSIISIPILVSNLFVFGKSTYVGYTKDNIFSWFSLPFDMYDYHPRFYATKFFFEEGNTIGILLFMVLPFLYYFFLKEERKLNKTLLGILIFVQSISMIILSTRIATYGALLVPGVILVVYIFLLVLKKEKLKKLFIVFAVFMMAVTGFVIPYGPAYQNQLIDASDYEFVKNEEYQRSDARALLGDGEGLEKWSEDWRDFYVYMFEDYSFLINVTPPIYYTEWYSYEYDPEFWVDLIFDYELEERVSGRQIETIFTKYKWDELTAQEKLTGFGYGTFMRGGIVIEKDFTQQYYSYGLIGFVLLMAPWLILMAIEGIKLLLGYKKGKWTFFNIVCYMAAGMGLCGSYMSGHVMDELTTSLFIALCLAGLWINLKKNEEIQ